MYLENDYERKRTVQNMAVNSKRGVDFETNSTIESDNHFAYILSFVSGKGGVGKTGLAINVSNISSLYGKKVLLIDCDLNTNGSTIFWGLNKKVKSTLSSKTTLTFQLIMNAITFDFSDEGDSKIETSISNRIIQLMSDYSIFSINEKFDFIPASHEKFIFNERYLNARNINSVESNLEHFFDTIRTKYDIIILDCGAGYSSLINLLNKCADKICIVLEDNEISRLATQNALSEWHQSFDFQKVQCCVNMIRKEKNSKINHSALINVTGGIAFSQYYAEMYNRGKTIETDDVGLCIQLSNIVESLVPSEKSIAADFLFDLYRQERHKVIKLFAIIVTVIVLLLLLLVSAIVPDRLFPDVWEVLSRDVQTGYQLFGIFFPFMSFVCLPIFLDNRGFMQKVKTYRWIKKKLKSFRFK